MVCAVLAACGGGEQTAQNPSRPREVRVDWLGHESFLFRSSLGTTIVTNPFNASSVGRTFPTTLRPDLVLISNEQAETNNVDAFDNTPTIFRGAVGMGPNNAAGLRIRGVPTYRNPDQEDVTEMNLVFSWILDGVRFCFAGNIQGPLSAAEAIQVGPVDVLFLPVGVPAGLTNTERQTIINQLRPRLVVPMGRAADIPAWAAGFSRVHRLPGSSVLFSPDTFPPEPTVLVFANP